MQFEKGPLQRAFAAPNAGGKGMRPSVVMRCRMALTVQFRGSGLLGRARHTYLGVLGNSSSCRLTHLGGDVLWIYPGRASCYLTEGLMEQEFARGNARQPKAIARKKPYERPSLQVFGGLHLLTQGTGIGAPDAGSGMVMT